MFTIPNTRLDHHYRQGDSHVVLSEDNITYPDGSTEQRIEIEHVAGNPDLLNHIHEQLLKAYPDLTTVKRGKLSEGRRRLLALLK